MAATAEDVRIEIGLEGGQGVHLTTDAKQWDALQKTLSAGGAEWASVTSKDGAEYRIATGKVGYVRVVPTSKSVGFDR